MRTLEEVVSRLDELVKESAKIRKDKLIRDADKKKQIKPISREFKFLKKIRNYLEYGPTEISLRAQKTLLEKQLESFREPGKYASWHSWNKERLNPLQHYEKEFIKPIKDRIKTLNFILNENE
jgi:hypothetical protein